MDIIIFLLLLPLYLSSTECPLLKCISSKDKACFRKEIKSDYKNIEIRPCYQNKMCERNLTFPSGFQEKGTDEAFCVKKTVKVFQLFPGDSCSLNAQCFSGNCTKGACLGKPENKTCAAHAECLNGLACIDSKCKKQKSVGEKCKNDYECINTAGCDSKGFCRSYFSLENGDEVPSKTIENKYFHKLCKSGQAFSSGGSYYCASLVGEKESCESECPFTADYGSSKPSEKFNMKCECSWVDNTTKYCPMSSNNKVFVKGISNFNKSISKHSKKLHSVNRFEVDYDSVKGYQRLLLSPKFDQDEDDCIIDGYLSGGFPSVKYIFLGLFLGLFM